MSERLSVDQRIGLGPDDIWFSDENPGAGTIAWARAQAARRHILCEPYLETEGVANFLRISEGEATRRGQRGALLRYIDHGDDLFPFFQFNDEIGHTKPIVSTVNNYLGNNWPTVNWWLKPNATLHGETPKDVLAADPQGTNFKIQLAAMRTDVHDPAFMILDR